MRMTIYFLLLSIINIHSTALYFIYHIDIFKWNEKGVGGRSGFAWGWVTGDVKLTTGLSLETVS